MKWNAYEAVKGMDKKLARDEFVKHATQTLEEHGFSAVNPDKARIDEEYKTCVAKKIASGKSQEEIEKEANEYSHQQALVSKEGAPLDISGLEFNHDYITRQTKRMRQEMEGRGNSASVL